MLHLLLQLSWLCPWDREPQIPAWHRAGAAAELCLYSHFVNTLAQISGDFFFPLSLLSRENCRGVMPSAAQVSFKIRGACSNDST